MDLEQNQMVRHIQMQIYLLVGLLVGVFIIALLYMLYLTLRRRVLEVTVVKHISKLGDPADDECSYIVSLSGVKLSTQDNGILVQDIVVSLKSSTVQLCPLEIVVKGITLRKDLVGRTYLPYAGMTPDPECYIKCEDPGSVFVERSVRKQLVPVRSCSMVRVATMCVWENESGRLCGLNLQVVKFKYVFIPIIFCRPFLEITSDDLTQVFKWDGSSYRMLNGAGKYLVSTVDYNEEIYVESVVGLPGRPRWKFSSRVCDE